MRLFQGRLPGAWRDEQLLRHRARREDHARLPHEARGASGEVPQPHEEHDVVRHDRQSAADAADVPQPGAARPAGV